MMYVAYLGSDTGGPLGSQSPKGEGTRNANKPEATEPSLVTSASPVMVLNQCSSFSFFFFV